MEIFYKSEFLVMLAKGLVQLSKILYSRFRRIVSLMQKICKGNLSNRNFIEVEQVKRQKRGEKKKIDNILHARMTSYHAIHLRLANPIGISLIGNRRIGERVEGLHWHWT